MKINLIKTLRNILIILVSQFFLILPAKSNLLTSSTNKIIVWNVGQGQFITYIEKNKCWHFDMGGEFFNWKRVQQLCGNKQNEVTLSHIDSDHINGLWKAYKHLKTICIHPPSYIHIGLGKSKMLEHYPKCLEPTDRRYNNSIFKQINIENLNVKNENQLSKVISLMGIMLIPGDSPINEEKRWHFNLTHENQIKYLILGHHGSRTSTSEELLHSLPHLEMAIASSRFKKYHHPHAETLFRLRKNKTPVLKTEDWGHIILEL